MSMWNGLSGVPGYAAGTSGTASIPAGAIIISIFATATSAASIVLFGGASIPVPAGTTFNVDFKHALWTVRGPGSTASSQIVFANTTSYFVQYVQPAH